VHDHDNCSKVSRLVNLTDTVGELIEYVFIEPLQLLVFDLIIDHASDVRYSGSKLKLYEA